MSKNISGIWLPQGFESVVCDLNALTDPTTEQIVELLHPLAKRMTELYAFSYREFSVGCVAVAERLDGFKFPFVGANTKFTEFSQTNCAEQNALDGVVLEGFTRVPFLMIATDKNQPDQETQIEDEFFPPCKPCRESMLGSLLIKPDTVIVSAKASDPNRWTDFTASALLARYDNVSFE